MDQLVKTQSGGTGEKSSSRFIQYSTFFVAGRLYGIDVTRVQEVVKPMRMTTVPLAPSFVRGLINLRGQVATAIGLRELFELHQEPSISTMNVICRIDSNLVSLLVDEIGDVIEVSSQDYEKTPQTIPLTVRRFMDGVYKVNSQLLSIIDVDKINEFLNTNSLR